MASTHETMARKIVPMILFGSLVFVAILYLGSHNPELFSNIKDSVGGSNAIADGGDYNAQQLERDRYRRIEALLISDVNKRDLKEGRPFWNATPALVDLAFGASADHTSLSISNSISFEFHDYELSNGRIVAEFQDGKLSCMHYAADGKAICNQGRVSYYQGAPYPFDTAQKQ